MQKSLKYLGYTVACQEVPNEISLIIDISGCPHHCGGCHSPQLCEYEGSYIKDDLQSLIDKYPSMLTCVCFMGGDQNMGELNDLLHLVKENGLKTCVYSGYDSFEVFDLSLLDYLKIGRFDMAAGGLDSNTTNQNFYKVENGDLKDVTYIFQQKKS